MKTTIMISKFWCSFLVILTINTSGFSQEQSCNFPALPSVYISGPIINLSAKAKLTLDTVGVLMKYFPQCKIKVSSLGDFNTILAQERGWEKTSAVITYLRKKGFSKEKFIFEYGAKGPNNEVRIIATNEDGPDWVPEALPCLNSHLPKSKRCGDSKGNVRP